MTAKRFSQHLDTWGSDLGRWPARQRQEAEALLRHSDEALAGEAREALRREQALDALLRMGDTPECPGSDRMERLMAATLATARVTPQETAAKAEARGAGASVAAVFSRKLRAIGDMMEETLAVFSQHSLSWVGLPSVVAMMIGIYVGSTLPQGSQDYSTAGLSSLVTFSNPLEHYEQ